MILSNRTCPGKVCRFGTNDKSEVLTRAGDLDILPLGYMSGEEMFDGCRDLLGDLNPEGDDNTLGGLNGKIGNKSGGLKHGVILFELPKRLENSRNIVRECFGHFPWSIEVGQHIRRMGLSTITNNEPDAGHPCRTPDSTERKNITLPSMLINTRLLWYKALKNFIIYMGMLAAWSAMNNKLCETDGKAAAKSNKMSKAK